LTTKIVKITLDKQAKNIENNAVSMQETTFQWKKTRIRYHFRDIHA